MNGEGTAIANRQFNWNDRQDMCFNYLFLFARAWTIEYGIIWVLYITWWRVFGIWFGWIWHMVRVLYVVLYLYLNEFLIESMIYNLNIIYVFIPNVGQNKVSIYLGSQLKDAFLVYLDACHPYLLIIQTYLRLKSDLIGIIRGEYVSCKIIWS